jgi:hypothetical protein
MTRRREMAFWVMLSVTLVGCDEGVVDDSCRQACEVASSCDTAFAESGQTVEGCADECRDFVDGQEETCADARVLADECIATLNCDQYMQMAYNELFSVRPYPCETEVEAYEAVCFPEE